MCKHTWSFWPNHHEGAMTQAIRSCVDCGQIQILDSFKGYININLTEEEIKTYYEYGRRIPVS